MATYIGVDTPYTEPTRGGVMQLQTLGGLRLTPSTFTRPKPLLLLAYLVLEGTQQRSQVAELFWQQGNRMKSLSMALTLLRQGAGDVVDIDAKQVKAKVESDIRELLVALDKSEWERAASLYTGAFLEGVVLEDWSSELEEWVYSTREYLAERVQDALLHLAEDAAKRQDFPIASGFAERAYKLPGLSGTDVTHLKTLYTLLCAGNSLLAPEVRREAESYDIALQLTSEEARALFKSETKAISSLPVRATSFIGRAVELTELVTLLNKPSVSLLTLLGTAGVGKTRLALQLAYEQRTLGTFKDDVYFIPLESLGEASLIPPRLLSHLGLSQQGKTEPLRQLVNFFEDKHVLLVLDNFEHLTAGAINLSLLLSNCPRLKILVTSRETLKLEEEHVFTLEGLSFPKTLSDEALLSDAVQLFKERAQQVKAQFKLEEQLTDVVRICGLVDGLPLGIELAASWVKLMSCGEIAREIERGLELLSSTAKNIPERHRSLKAAFEYSWNLLTAKEQEVLRKLSVFHGGFRREAASEVAGATIPALASLLDKSLIRITPEHRYTFHPLLQNFTREKFAEDNDEEARVRERHGHYYLRLLEAVQQSIRRGNQKAALGQLDEDFDNAVTAWQWASNKGLSEALLKSVGAFRTFFTELGRTREGEQFFARAIEQLNLSNKVDKRLLVRFLGNQAWYRYVLADFSEATELAKRCLALSTSLQDTSGQFAGANVLACVFMDSGEYEQARHYSRESLSYARTQQDIYLLIPALVNLGSLENELNNFSEAEKHYREALALCREEQDFIYITATMNNLAFILKETNRLDEATKLLEESLAISRPMNLRPSQMYATVTLAMIYSQRGQTEKSIQYARDGLGLAKAMGAKKQEEFIGELLELQSW